MAFGSTRARHKEVATSHLDHAEWSLTEAYKARTKGKCSSAVSYAIEAIRSSGAFAAHVVAQNLSRSNEQHDLQVARVQVGHARRLIDSCCGRK